MEGNDDFIIYHIGHQSDKSSYIVHGRITKFELNVTVFGSFVITHSICVTNVRYQTLRK